MDKTARRMTLASKELKLVGQSRSLVKRVCPTKLPAVFARREGSAKTAFFG
jgi:hypothetical protein